MSSRGHDRERQVRHQLESDDWWVARAAGSLGDADLVALRAGARPRLIEVKSTKGGPYERFGPAARARLALAAHIAGADPWLCWWPPYVRRPTWIAAADWPENRGGDVAA